MTITKISKWLRMMPELFSIDYHMLPCKVAYILYSAGLGHTLFITVFLTSVGLSSGEAGFINGMSYLGSAIASPLWGLIADYNGKRHVIFYVMIIGACVSTSFLPWIAVAVSPHRDNPKRHWQESNTSGTHYFHIGNNGTTDQNVLPAFQSNVFYAMLVLNIISFIFTYPFQGLLESIVMNIVENNYNDVDYGSQRAFGSIGYGISNLLAGYVADKFQIPGMSKYIAIFIVFLVFEILLMPLGVILYRKTSWSWSMTEEYVQLHSKDKEGESKDGGHLKNRKSFNDNQLKALKNTFNNTQNVIFLLTILVVGILRQVSFPFLFLLMKDEMNSTRTAMGMASFVGTVTEFLIFPRVTQIIEKIGSPMRCIQLGLLGYIVRLIGISIVKNQWVMVIPQLLDGPSFAMFWAGSVEYLRRICREEIHTTMYTILGSLFWGFSASIGSIAGGFLYHKYGGPLLYRGAALCGVVWGLILFTHFELLPFFKRRSNKQRDEELIENAGR